MQLLYNLCENLHLSHISNVIMDKLHFDVKSSPKTRFVLKLFC